MFGTAQAQAIAAARAMSECIEGVPVQLSPGSHGGERTLTLTEGRTNVLTVTAAELGNFNIAFDGGVVPSADTALVVNIVGDTGSVFIPGFTDVTNPSAANPNPYAPHVIWNFGSSTGIIEVNGNLISGTLFAPEAELRPNANSPIEGQIVSDVLETAGGEIHHYGFASALECEDPSSTTTTAPDTSTSTSSTSASSSTSTSTTSTSTSTTSTSTSTTSTSTSTTSTSTSTSTTSTTEAPTTTSTSTSTTSTTVPTTTSTSTTSTTEAPTTTSTSTSTSTTSTTEVEDTTTTSEVDGEVTTTTYYDDTTTTEVDGSTTTSEVEGGITSTSYDDPTTTEGGDVGGGGTTRGRGTGGTGAAGDDLARTGSGSAPMLIATGTLMLALGAAAMMIRRRLA